MGHWFARKASLLRLAGILLMRWLWDGRLNISSCCLRTIFEELEPPPTEVFVGKYVVNDQGVHEIRFNDKREPYRVWICSRLDVVARTRNENDQNWGLLLQWKDPDGNVHEWSMPISLLSGSGEQYRQQLLDEGLLIAPGNAGKEALTGYLMAVRPMERALCVDKTGWHGNVFVLPHKTFGQSSERVILQTGESSRTIPFATSGTLQEWNEHVGAKCVGNSRLKLAVCVALSGPFLKPMEQENGGLHLRGESSSGKTKALSVAASVWGGKRMVRTWRTTDNAIESLAAQHNECVLILDELGQVDPDKAGDIAYCLGNGQSKARANRFGNARPTMSWSLLFISTGEIPLAEHIAQSGERARAGQEIRLLDIPSDAGRGMGLFENLHGASSARDFADSLQQLAEQYHGTAAEGLLNSPHE